MEHMGNYFVGITEKRGLPKVFQHIHKHWQTGCPRHQTTVGKKIVKE